LAILLAWDGFSQLKTKTVKILEGVEFIEATQESSLECGLLASHPAIKNDSSAILSTASVACRVAPIGMCEMRQDKVSELQYGFGPPARMPLKAP
jgi:hypothetical protein